MNDPLIIHLKKRTKVELISAFVPHDTPGDASLELQIKIESKNINIRELGAFLIYLDNLYGRLQVEGIYSYAHRRESQIVIDRIKVGSVEVIISSIIDQIDPNQIILIYFVIKYLPNAIHELLSAYKDYEEARLTRINRRILKQLLDENQKLSKLTDKQKNDIIKFLDKLFKKDRMKLPAVIRFLRYHLIDIKINIKKK